MQKIASVVRRFTHPPAATTDSQQALNELKSQRETLGIRKNELGTDVYRMLETGDSLSALAHGARTAQMHGRIIDEPKE